MYISLPGQNRYQIPCPDVALAATLIPLVNPVILAGFIIDDLIGRLPRTLSVDPTTEPDRILSKTETITERPALPSLRGGLST